MTDSISHRGPDDDGIESLHDGRVVLGHRRLSIIDLSPLGHQPMASPSRRSWIVFNGEIYNYREIRRELEALGRAFRSGSDTEVILAAYETWGLKSVERMRGMFAFALWDGEQGLLHLCRDRFGVKPLYYCSEGEQLTFASELRAFAAAGVARRSIDPVSAAEFLQFGYITAPRTVFDDIRAVEPGTILSFGAARGPQLTRYWCNVDLFTSPAQMKRRAELAQLRDEDLLDELEESLREAFAYRMVADVPVGLFLSGGIDSSAVATVLARRAGVKLRTFTIGYEGSEFDEVPFAREVASRLEADHTEVILSESVALDVVSRLPQIADEPIGDSSLIPTFLVSREARRHVTVALSADGADELFGGYPRYAVCGKFVGSTGFAAKTLYSLAGGLLERLPAGVISAAYALSRGSREKYAGINDKVRKFVRMTRAGSADLAYAAAVSEWSAADARALLGQEKRAAGNDFVRLDEVAGLAPEERFMYCDTTRYLPGDLLTKVDRASMAVSLEARDPFLDHEMARFAAALPLHWKIRDGKNKYALRRILARHLPTGLFDRPKKGFSVPIADWMRGPLRHLLTDELAPARVRRLGILDNDMVQAALRDFLEGRSAKTSPAGLWFILQLQQWAAHWSASAVRA